MRSKPRRGADAFHRRRFQRDIDRHQGRRRQRQSARRSHSARLAGRPVAVQRRKRRRSISRAIPASCSTPPADSRSAGDAPADARHRAHQQPAAWRDRSRARRPDAPRQRSERASRRRAGGIQIAPSPARCRRSRRLSPRSRIRGSSAPSSRRAPRSSCPATKAVRMTSSRPSRLSVNAAIRMLLGCSPACQPTCPRRSRKALPPRSGPSRTALSYGKRCRMPGTASRSARCCCSPPSGLPSPSG